MTQPTTSTGINIQPDVGVFSVLPHLNYQPWYALAEFVDNALESFLRYRTQLNELETASSKLKVEIDIDPSDGGLISIRDNAAGIHWSDYQRAFRLAEPPAGPKGLSEFGMGMKSAACWFGTKFSIRSSALGEDVERTIAFDVQEIVKTKPTALPVISKPAQENDHYTEIFISQLHRVPQGRTVGKIKDHLASIYRVFIREGILELRLRSSGMDEVLTYEEPEILSAPPADSLIRKHNLSDEPRIWRKDIDIDLGEGRRATGFVALRAKASTSLAGLALFRRRRLIEGSGEDSYRPSEIFGASTTAPYQRIFGELQLDGFDVSHTKDGFQWDSTRELFLKTLRDQMNEPPMPIIDQARDASYSRFRKDKENDDEDIGKFVDEAVKDTGEILEAKVTPILNQQIDVEPSEQSPPVSLPQVQESWQEEFELEIHSVRWKVTVEITNDPAVGDWVRVFDADEDRVGEVRKLGVSLSLAHPFTERFVGADPDRIKPFVRIAAAIGLAEITAREAGAKATGQIRRNINQLLRDVLSQS